jgi:hypothetical protein
MELGCAFCCLESFFLFEKKKELELQQEEREVLSKQ